MIVVVGCYQSLSVDVDKAKKLVSECVELADKLQTSPVCSEVARISLHKQLKELRTSSAEVDEDWCRKRAKLQTELAHRENYYACYQVHQ